MKFKSAILLIALTCLSCLSIKGQDDDGYEAQRNEATTYALRRLTDKDPIVRQHAAEVLAKFSAVEHQNLVEGYRLQEKNDRVRLALDWALYRMGKNNALYEVVRGLKSDQRHPQAVGYLVQIGEPKPLYPFFDRADGKTMLGLLQVMATIGDAGSLDLIQPFVGSYEPGVADGATFAIKEITGRLDEAEPNTVTRPREVRVNRK